MFNMESNTNFIRYLNMRELGRVSRDDSQHLSDSLTPKRSMRPVLADAPVNCRSTYLLRLNANNRFVAAAHGDRSVAIYCTNTGGLLAKCIGHERSPWGLVFHPSEPYLLASGCLGGEIKIWNIEALANASVFEQSNPITIHAAHTWKRSGSIASIAFHPRHAFLAVAWGQEVVFYDWVEQHVLSTWRFVADQSRLRWLKFSPDGTLLYTATANPPIVLPYTDVSRRSAAEASTGSVSANDRYANLGLEYPPCIPREYIPRDTLLEFLVRQTEHWYRQLNICTTCSVRLCRWAGTLSPIFPSLNTDTQRGWTMAYRVARQMATRLQMSGSTISEVLKHIVHPEPSEEIMTIRGDAKPAAVAIIEDTPVQEFLLSRTSYCTRKESSVMFPLNTAASRGEGIVKGVCCGGHACDLVLTHRELLRHSLCRSCLTGFWCWASCFVAWWEWNPNRASVDEIEMAPTNLRRPLLPHQQPDDDDDQIIPLIDITDPLSDLDDEFDEPDERLRLVPNYQLLASQPAGICARCCDTIGGGHRNYADDDTDTDDGGRDITRYDNLAVYPASVPPSVFQQYGFEHAPTTQPMSAEERIQTSQNLLTASNIVISDRQFTSQLHTLLQMANIQRRTTVPVVVSGDVQQTIASLYRSQWQDDDVFGPPLSKRSRIVSENNDNLPTSQASQLSAQVPGTSGGSTTNSDSLTHLNLSLADRASKLGFHLGGLSQQYRVYNYPRSAQTSEPDSEPTRVLPDRPFWPQFSMSPYAPDGVRALNNMAATLKSTKSEQNEGFLCRSPTMSACCRCGNIVAETFEVDQRSPLSAMICERLVLPEKPENYIGRNRYPSISSVHSIASANMTIDDDDDGEDDTDNDDYEDDDYVDDDVDVEEEEEVSSDDEEPGDSSMNTSTATNRGPPEQAPSTNQCNNTASANPVNRSISGIIAGMFLEVEEPSSQKSLHDSTYRVCRWELNFCGPVDCTLECPPHKEKAPIEGNENGREAQPKSSKRAFLPMPANWGASYSANNLIVPHARLFNDSSIAVSPDGRMLAAFVLTNEGMEKSMDQRNSPDTSRPSVIENVLSVFQLEPKRNLGQCLFTQCFPGTSPVCLDFSPFGNYLAVGMANARCAPSVQPLTPRPYGMGSGCRVPAGYSRIEEDVMEHLAVAHIFRLDRYDNSQSDQGGLRVMQRVVDIEHPAHLGPISVSSQFTGQHSLDRWHRVLLATPSGISLNSIVWKTNGGMFYGTNKGMIVMMRVEAEPARILPQLSMQYHPPAAAAAIAVTATTTTTTTNTITDSAASFMDFGFDINTINNGDRREATVAMNNGDATCSNANTNNCVNGKQPTILTRYMLADSSVPSTSNAPVSRLQPTTNR